VKNVSWHVVDDSPQGTVWAERWAPLRDGQADLPAYFKALAAHGYDGWVTVEDFSTAQPLSDRTRDNLAYLRSLRRSSSGR
jgi:sugar phosphate isomerase/epimerase